MFEKSRVPPQNAQLKQHFQNLYAQVAIHPEIRSLVDKKFDKVLTQNKEKITQAVTISEYLDQLWKQPDLKEKHKDYAIKKLEVIHKTKIEQILKGEQNVAKTPANLEVVNGIFQMTPFEEFNYTEKLKNIKKRRQLDIESDLFARHPVDLDVLHAINRAPKSAVQFNRAENVHYAAGLCDVDITLKQKVLKAEEFVKKIKDEKKEFSRKIKQIEKAMDARENQDIERYKKLEQEEEERRLKEKKQRIEENIQKIKANSEARLKVAQAEGEYFEHFGKPMFKKIEREFKRGYAIPELEERKRKLQEIRALHKPITKDDILEHEQKVKKRLDELSLEKKEHAQTSKWNYEKPSFESKHHKTVAEELSNLRNQKENYRSELQRKKEKVIELLQEVKEKHLPKADPQKELELANLVEELKKKKHNGRLYDSMVEEKVEDAIDVKKLGAGYLREAKEYIQKHKKKDISESPIKGGETPRKHQSATMASSPTIQSPTIKSKDYLAELRRDNKIQSSANQVDIILKNKKLDGLDKKGRLESEVEKLEEKVKRKEVVNKYYKNKKDEDAKAQDNAEVDQMYLNAIKAKLELLSS